MSIRTVFILIIVALISVSCDQQKISQSKTKSLRSLNIKSIDEVNATAPFRGNLSNLVSESEIENLQWGQARKVTLEINNGDVHSAVVIPSSPGDRMLKVAGMRHSVDRSQVVYVPSLNYAFREEFSMNSSGSGYFSVSVIGTNASSTFEVRDGNITQRIATTKGDGNGPRTRFYEGTFECYDAAKDACGTDGECEAMCDFMDPFCSASIITACGIINNF